MVELAKIVLWCFQLILFKPIGKEELGTNYYETYKKFPTNPI